MLNNIKLISFLTKANGYSLFFYGLISGLAFAPVFFLPALFFLGNLIFVIKKSENFRQAFLKGLSFGFGHFLSSMHWVVFAIFVFIKDFWWAVPFALFGLPFLLSLFIAFTCLVSKLFDNSRYYYFFFCAIWVLFEWVRSWIFTGFPWNLLGYALSWSDVLPQISSLVGIYGLSFLVILFFASIYYLLINDKKNFKIIALVNLVILILAIFYAYYRIYSYDSSYLPLKVKIVQPSIEQSSKWQEQYFLQDLEKIINLSKPLNDIDILVWSEAALTIPYQDSAFLQDKISSLLRFEKTSLITGGITYEYVNPFIKIDDNMQLTENDFKLYSSMQVIENNGLMSFAYHKSHLVPYGEYVPFKNLMPFKKLTAGSIDYSAGEKKIMYLAKQNIFIKPLICYEAIFPDLVRFKINNTDLIINIVNDAWYGNSFGPYQHFEIGRMRAIENGIALIRAANNGISAIIDPIGRVIKKLGVNEVGIIEGFIPQKILLKNLYAIYGEVNTILLIFLVFILIRLVTRFF